MSEMLREPAGSRQGRAGRSARSRSRGRPNGPNGAARGSGPGRDRDRDRERDRDRGRERDRDRDRDRDRGRDRDRDRDRGRAGPARARVLRCRQAALQTDIRDYSAILAVCEGADCVFHVASYGMSGTEQLHKKEIETVNINGTRLILNACKQQNIPRLVYTSSVNVVFGGLPIEDGDEESLPYFPIDKLVDHYSRTKSIAEQMVLAANGSALEGGGILHTCVLRPPGIYGPEEQRHLPRLAKIIERRLLSFKFGDPSVKMNWIHVENFVQAHILAAEALTPEKNYIASGQVYFIHDGEKSNLFEWLTPLFERLGCSKPWIRIPTCLVYASATFMEHLHAILRPVVDLPPLLTRNEVQNISVTHTFRIDKARAQLGYRPQKFDFADSVDHYIESRPQPSNYQLFLNILLTLFVAFILVFLSSKLDNLSVLHYFKGRH
uniref:Putative short-chain dehydrogenase/reductase family 42E member 2 n=1 Tax=Taeniopygia guttata TaxID=59729 RepID=A0A674GNR7_TAEGU